MSRSVNESVLRIETVIASGLPTAKVGRRAGAGNRGAAGQAESPVGGRHAERMAPLAVPALDTVWRAGGNERLMTGQAR
ncbi:hypothetical protein Maq22A_c01440 [Methylobacterium aquaticum]|uniref:Uncharacterized protein n=1 Tax=Methylobacterium aquaticum TaxID=270351 RepID=A0A0C6EUX2_9HYPH|nr:hypothetical protein Maq22A_c01440 [Methylobacterium aquaticum]